MVNKIQLDNLIRIYSVWIKLFLVSPDIIIWWHTGLNPAQWGKIILKKYCFIWIKLCFHKIFLLKSHLCHKISWKQKHMKIKILLQNWFSKSFVLVQTRALLSPIDFPRPYYLVYLDDIRYLQKCGNSSHIPDPHTCITLLDSLV